MNRRKTLVSSVESHNATYLLDKANEVTDFVRKQKQRSSKQSAKQQWLLTTAKLAAQGSQVEGELIALLAELPDAASLHTQLLVFRQEWSELQQDLLAQAGQDVQILQLLPPPCSVQQQRHELIAAVQSLDSAYHTARADLMAEWPTALESPLLQDELPKLQDSVNQLCQQYSAAASVVKQGLQDQASYLQADFQRRLADWDHEMHKLGSSHFSRKHSTWSQRDRDLLAQMSQQFVSDMSASTRESVSGYMAAMLPDKAIPDIAGHSDWQWQKRTLDRRLRDLLCAWEKAHKAFLSDASRMLQQSVQRQAASSESAAERLRLITAQHELHGQLKVMRCEKYVAEALHAADLEAEEQALAEKQEEVARERQLQTQQNKQQLALYHAALAAARAEAQAAADAQAEEDAIQARVQSQANQERVSYRQAETAHREQLKLEKGLWLQQEQQEREDRLDRLRAQVLVDVDADPERARAATVASAAQEAEHAAAFAPVHGYTTETLLRDKRFKVLEALRQHSLHNTGYARHALLAVPPATQPRRDMLSTAGPGVE